MKPLRILLALVLTTAAGVADELPPVSLDQLLREAAAKNPDAQAALHRWEAAKLAVPAAKAWDDPMLNLGFFAPTDSATPASMDGDLSYGLSQRIPFFGKKALAGTIAEREAARIYEDYATKLLDVAAGVKSAYYDLYFAGKNVEIARENLRLLEQSARATLARYSVGKVSQGDVLRAQIETSKQATELVTLERMRHDRIATLNRLLGRKPDASFGRVPDFASHTVKLDESALWSMALEHRPAIRGAQHEVARGQAAVELAKKQRYPDVEAGLSLKHYTGDSGLRMAEFAIGIPLPWWNEKKYSADIRRERESKAAAEQDLANLRNTTMEEIHHFVTQADTAQRLVALYRGGVLTQTRQSVEASAAAYQTGQSDFLTLLDAQRTWRNTQLDYYRALADYEKAIAMIEQMTGQPMAKP